MNEGTGMTIQGIPLSLIVIGVGLIAGLAILLKKMKEGGKEKAVERSGEISERSEEKAQKQEFFGEEESVAVEISSEKTGREKPRVSPPPSGIPVHPDPIEETPGIDRKSFSGFAGRHILVVEDNPVNRKLILTLLDGSGIALETAEDGMEALEKLRNAKEEFELVLMDVHMPRMDGLEAARQIRADEKLGTLPVVALTASTTAEEVRQILESGMNAYLDKPLELGKIYTAFRIFLKERKTRDEQPKEEKKKETEEKKEEDILDTDVGLEHTNGDRELYRALLKDFLEEYGDSADRFRQWVEAGDYERLKRMIIDMEGLSGTLGAMRLLRLVDDIVQLFQRGEESSLSGYVTRYDNEMDRLKSGIKSFLAGG